MAKGRNALILGVIWALIGALPYINDQLSPAPVAQPHSYLTDLQSPYVLCHRGSRYLGPENTIYMHQWAIKLGCDVIETDVRLTKDGRLVILHDDTVDRVCNGKGPVESLTFEELRALDCGHNYSPQRRHYRHDGIHPEDEVGLDYPYRGKELKAPLFSEFMDAFPTFPKNLEIKENDNKVADAILSELKKRPGSESSVVVASRWCEVLDYFRSITNGTIATSACEKEGIRLVLLTKLGLSNLAALFSPPKNQVYQVPVVSAGIDLLSSDIVDSVHKLGQKIHYWVVNDEETMTKVWASGADAVVSDRCDLAKKSLITAGNVKDTRAKIPAEQVNSDSGYFIPIATPSEVHTCVSWACVVTPFIFAHLRLVSGSVAVASFLAVFLLS